MRFSVFSLFAFASGFSADTFANFNNPDAVIEMMKTMVIPMMKNAYDQLDHEKMHEEMMEDNIQMIFVDRGFDFCVGEEAQEMSYEDDLNCSKRIFEMIIDHVPEEIPTETYIQEQDQGKILYALNFFFIIFRIDLSAQRALRFGPKRSFFTLRNQKRVLLLLANRLSKTQQFWNLP